MGLFRWRDPKLDRPVIQVRVVWKKRPYNKVWSMMTATRLDELPAVLSDMGRHIWAEIEEAENETTAASKK